MKPINLCYILNIIDKKLIVTNSELDISAIELGGNLLSFYFNVKSGSTKLAFYETKELSILDQESIIRTALVDVELFLSF